MNREDKIISLGEEIMIRELKERLGYNEEKDDGIRNENNAVKKCIFCGNRDKLLKYMGKYYCYSCYQELQDIR